jgi:hypothetical protein
MFSSLELKAAKQVVLFCPALVWLARRALIRIAIVESEISAQFSRALFPRLLVD